MHLDNLGSVEATTAADQSVETRYRTDAWGNVASGSAADNPFDWAGGLGYWHDDSLALQYVRARWYDPSTGEWLSVDPVEGQPRYLYVGQAPTWRVDPSGRQRLSDSSGQTWDWSPRGRNSSQGRGGHVDVHVNRGGRVYIESEAGGYAGGIPGKLSSPGTPMALEDALDGLVTMELSFGEWLWRGLVDGLADLGDAALKWLGVGPVGKGAWESMTHRRGKGVLALVPPVPQSPDAVRYWGGAMWGAAETAAWMFAGTPSAVIRVIKYLIKLPNIFRDLYHYVVARYDAAIKQIPKLATLDEYGRGKIVGILVAGVVGLIIAGRSVAKLGQQIARAIQEGIRTINAGRVLWVSKAELTERDIAAALARATKGEASLELELNPRLYGRARRAAPDALDVALARRIGGLANREVEGYATEFDALSRKFVAQTTDSGNAVVGGRFDNYWKNTRRQQVRLTLQYARDTGRVAVFETTAGEPSPRYVQEVGELAAEEGARAIVVGPGGPIR